MLNPILNHPADVYIERNYPFALIAVLEGSSFVGAIADFKPFVLAVVVLQIKRLKRPKANPGMPQDFQDDVPPRGVLKPT